MRQRPFYSAAPASVLPHHLRLHSRRFFPIAYAEYQRAVSMPIYSRMSDQDVEDVITAVRQIIAANRR